MFERTKTSIMINDEVWKQVKIQAIKEDKELCQLVEKALTDYLVSNKK